MLKRMFAALLLVPFLAAPSLAEPGADAATFVRNSVDRGIAILTETPAEGPERATQFRTFVGDIIDSRSVALFTLGHYRKGADKQTLSAFVAAFHSFATASYESRLGAYGGQIINVGDTLVRSDTDILVKGTIDSAKGKHLADVAFRVLKTRDGLQLFDVRVEGIWLAVEQRNQFGSYLAQHDGKIQTLIDYLNNETAKLRAGETTAASAEG